MKKILYLLYKVKIWLLSIYYTLFPQKGTYKGLYRYKDVFSVAKYINVRNRIFRRAVRKIQKKSNKTIRIVMIESSEWCATEIYNYFNGRGVDIAVVPSPYFHGTEESIRKAYASCCRFCESKGMRYIDAFDPKDWTFTEKDIRCVQGDVMIYFKPWMGTYPEQVSLYNMPLSSISCYIPYGFMVKKSEQTQFNQPTHNMFTHIFCESELHRQLYEKYCDIGSSHVEFSGHPKMDPLAKDKSVDDQAIWKGCTGNTRKVKIIYSPHWGFRGGNATFMDNAYLILEYAEAHPDTTSWIYKPHPLLEKEVVIQGYMSAEDYREYVDRWRNLPNARVYLTGDYTDIFKTSDCILNDSFSFITEYMYAHRPMLLLQNEQGKNARYNLFGQRIVSHMYTCRGDDRNSIVEFIENVRAGKDDRKKEREQFFHENLDYYHLKGQFASEYIASRITGILGMDQSEC